MSLMATVWSTPLRKLVTAGLTAIGLVTGTIVSIDKAWPVVEPAVPALRYYVRDTTGEVERRIKMAQEAILKRLNDTQLEQAQGKLETTQDNLARWHLDYSKETDDQRKLLIGRQIRELETTAIKLRSQINTLSSQQ